MLQKSVVEEQKTHSGVDLTPLNKPDSPLIDFQSQEMIKQTPKLDLVK